MPSNRLSTRIPSYSRRLSAGSRICVWVTVLSIRSRFPVSIPAALATPSKCRLMRSQVVALTAPSAACSADFFGSRAVSTRAKRCAERESRNANSSPRQVSWRRCLSTAQPQNRLAGQPVATARRPRIGAQIGGDLVRATPGARPTRPTPVPSRPRADGQWRADRINLFVRCVSRAWRLRRSRFFAFCLESKTRIAETPVFNYLKTPVCPAKSIH